MLCVACCSRYYALRLHPDPLVISDVTLDQKAKILTLTIITSLCVWITGATGTFVFVLGIGAFLGAVHASCRELGLEQEFLAASEDEKGSLTISEV